MNNFDPNQLIGHAPSGDEELTKLEDPNIVVIPIIDHFVNGSHPVTVVNFAYFVITSWTKSNVRGRFVKTGAPGGHDCPSTPGGHESADRRLRPERHQRHRTDREQQLDGGEPGSTGRAACLVSVTPFTARERTEPSNGRRCSGTTMGTDIGGTFTDLIAVHDDGDVVTNKVLSVPLGPTNHSGSRK